MRLNWPTKIAIGCAIALFIVFLEGWLTSWTPLAGSYARDYITLPRCGLAVRFGTNMFTSSQDYPWFGPTGTGWVSHPALCVLGGIPTSYLPPIFGFKLLNFFYLILQIGIIVVFGRRLTAPYRIRDFVVFVAIGLFFPWYAMYVTGQYHALSVLAVALVLAGSRHRVAGFVISAVAKPVLGPAGIILLLRGHWRQALKIGVLVAALTLPFALFGYSTHGGLHTHGHLLSEFWTQGKLAATPLVPHWDQQMSLATFIDEVHSVTWNAHLRLVLTIIVLVFSIFVLHRRPMEVAIALSTLWFFVYYARGHEYQGTLFVPVFLYLWTEPRGIYRTPWLALLVVVYALPSTWPIWIHLMHLPGPGPDSFTFMRAKSPLLFWLFVGQKPVTGLLVIVTIAYTELRHGRVENLRIRVPRLENTSVPAAASAPGAP